MLVFCFIPLAAFSQSDSSSRSPLMTSLYPEDQGTPVVLRSLPRLHDTLSINPVRLSLAGSVVVGSLAIIHHYQERAWWLGPRSPLWFKNDPTYALNIDKLGHMYASYFLSQVFGYTLSWCGLDRQTSTVWGGGLAAGYQLVLEVEDGYRLNWGFDPVDAFADIGGAAIPLLQESFPVLRNFSLKYSYLPSTMWKQMNNGDRLFIDDYDGMTLWLSVDPHFLMGERLSGVVPSWLGFSIGYAVRNLDYHGKGDRVYYLTLDYNLSKIQTSSDLLISLFKAVDLIHLPAPGVRLENGKMSFGIFYR